MWRPQTFAAYASLRSFIASYCDLKFYTCHNNTWYVPIKYLDSRNTTCFFSFCPLFDRFHEANDLLVCTMKWISDVVKRTISTPIPKLIYSDVNRSSLTTNSSYFHRRWITKSPWNPLKKFIFYFADVLLISHQNWWWIFCSDQWDNLAGLFLLFLWHKL